MLHADEGVFHSYLDGALRSHERLEVESHVAACAACAAAMQEARQLKSQATKILSRAQPPPLARPPRAMPDRRRKRPLIPLAWAASVAVALGAGGWLARMTFSDRGPGTLPVAQATEAAADEALGNRVDSVAPLASAALPDARAEREARTSTTRPAAPSPSRQTQPVAERARRSDAIAATPPAAKAAAEPPAVTADRLALEQQFRDRAAERPTEGQRERAQNEARAGQAVSEAAAGRAAAGEPSVRPVYAVPLVEALPGFTVAAVATGTHPLLVVTQLSAAGDTVVLTYERLDAPHDARRIFEQGLVLERDAMGEPLAVIGRYRVVRDLRITARGSPGISRDSLGTLLDALELRELR